MPSAGRGPRQRGAAGLVVGLALLAGCQTAENAVILQQTTTLSGLHARTDKSTQYWTEKLMVVDQGQSRIIVDFAAETITSMDTTGKTYVVQGFGELQAQVEAANERRRRETADYPEEAKAELERLGQLRSDKSTEVELKPTGNTDVIVGFEVREYTFRGNAASGSLWVSDAWPLPLGEAERAAFRRSVDGMNATSMQFALAMLQANALPLRTVMTASLSANGTTATNEVTDVRRGVLPAELARVPKDYRQRTPQAKSGG